MADSSINPSVVGGNGIDETSPDLLKNTPSNIARLEDLIENCKGRQMYLAQTRSPSDGGDVRWYFSEVPLAENELAPSSPQTEIVGKSDYFRFGMRDSLAIEASFLQREEELLSIWWKEYAECNKGPRGWSSAKKKLDIGEDSSSAKGSQSAQLYTFEEERVGVPVKRGLYEDELRQRKEEEMDDYCSQVMASYLFTAFYDYTRNEQVPVRHLVFMVHGIGQRLEKSNLVDDVGNFRHITASLAERHLTSHQLGTQRVLFIPCQWRKGLKLSGEAAVEKITLDGVRGLRVMLSATAHDVLYYMSPIYCQSIIDSVSNQLNRLYLKFLKRNPGYDGKVSIYGHSLGSVLSYDILCHQENLSSPFPMQCVYEKDSKDLECSPDMNNQSSKFNSLANLEEKNSTLMTKDTVDCLGEDMMIPLPNPLVIEGVAEDNYLIEGHVEDKSLSDGQIENKSLIEGLAEDKSLIEGHFEDKSLVSTKINAAAEDTMQKNCKEDVLQLLSDFSGTPWPEEGGLCEATKVESVVSDGLLEKDTEEDNEEAIDTDKTIKMLREEIDSLKVKIAELESHNYADTGENKEMIMQNPPKLQKSNQKLPLKLDDATKSYTPHIRYTKLEFKVDTFFAVGSPLGVFLALRNIRIGLGKGQDYWDEENISEEMPACHQMFNIFHPFDPVAYRVEPLVCKEYITKRPVIIPYHKGGRRLHVGFQEFTERLAARSHVVMDHFSTVRVKVLTACQSRNNDNLEEEEDVEETGERSYGSLMIERLTGSEDGRIDHVLQDKTFEHPYLQAIGSHTNYWRDFDTALFILKHLYRDIPEDPNYVVESKGESASTGWSDEREAIDEEFPLTFSDRIMVKNFSSKAKKFIKKP